MTYISPYHRYSGMALEHVQFAVQVAALLAALVLGAILEGELLLRNKLVVLWHKLVNSETRFQVGAVYATDMDYANVRDELKTVLRETYTAVDPLEEHKHDTVLEIDDTFRVTLEEDEDTVSLDTSKLTSTMRDMQDELGELVDALHRFQQRNREQASGSNDSFDSDTFSIELDLPYDSTFHNLHLPRGVELTDYSLTLDYPDYQCTIEDTAHGLRIETAQLADLHTIADRVLRTFSIWWKRMQ